MVVGIKKKMSKDAELSAVYTNHSIRATCITILDSAGVEARHIMAISGHGSESSIRSYARTSVEKKAEMSTHISTIIDGGEVREEVTNEVVSSQEVVQETVISTEVQQSAGTKRIGEKSVNSLRHHQGQLGIT